MERLKSRPRKASRDTSPSTHRRRRSSHSSTNNTHHRSRTRSSTEPSSNSNSNSNSNSKNRNSSSKSHRSSRSKSSRENEKENRRQRQRRGSSSKSSSKHKVHHGQRRRKSERLKPKSTPTPKPQPQSKSSSKSLDFSRRSPDDSLSLWTRLSTMLVSSCFESRMLRPMLNAMQVGFHPFEKPDIDEPKVEDLPEWECLEVEVLRTDELAEDPLIFHPLVRVSLVDGTTGKLVLKSDVDAKDVHTASILKVSMNEQGKSQTSRRSVEAHHVPPVLTGPCKIQEGPVHLVAPSWSADNVVRLNVSPAALIRTQYLLFFEILDFGGNIPPEKLKALGGFYPIAWGFLRLRGATGKPNFELRPDGEQAPLRLQLYKYKPLSAAMQIYFSHRCLGGEHGAVPEVFKLFLARNREEYASTLYVKVSARETAPAEASEAKSFNELFGQSIEQQVPAKSKGSSSTRIMARRGRKRREPCVIPDKHSLSIPCGNKGCFALSFSPDGKYLAAACADDLLFPVLIVNVFSGEIVHSLEGHHSIVYDVQWYDTQELGYCRHNMELATASGDSTVKIWAVPLPSGSRSKDTPVPELLHNFQHKPPTYVYAAKYHPIASCPHVVVSGAYDQAVHMWDAQSGDSLGKLDHARQHHRSEVFALAFSRDGNRLFSGDGQGVINVWRLETGREPADPNMWHLARRIDEPDLRGKSILTLAVHPSKPLLLVSGHQHVVRLLELRRYTKVHNGYIGAPVSRSTVRCCFSTDGKWVLSGGEDGKPHFWETESAAKARDKAWKLGFSKPIYAVDWCPDQHLIALASFGGNFPILLVEGPSNTSVSEEAEQENLFGDETPLEEVEKMREEYKMKVQRDRTERILSRIESVAEESEEGSETESSANDKQSEESSEN